MKLLAAALSFRLLLLGDMSYAPAPEEITVPDASNPAIIFSVPVKNADDSDDVRYQLSFELPDGWKWTAPSITTSDIEAENAGRFATERSETFPVYSDELFGGYFAETPSEKISGILANGLSYVCFTQSVTVEDWQLTSTPYRSAEQYFYNIELPDGGAYAKIVFTVYEEDPADYFATHLQPLLDSMEIIRTE